MSGDYEFEVDPVHENQSFTVAVAAAPCVEVVVEFRLNGELVDSQQVGVPGTQDFECPADSEGQTWSIIVKCAGSQGDPQTGTVAA